MTNHFPGHHPRPVSVDTLDGIEAVTMAIQQLHEAMTATSETHRWMAVSMMGDEIGDILRMIQVDQLQFSAQGLRDMSDQFVTRTATEDEIRQWHERQRGWALHPRMAISNRSLAGKSRSATREGAMVTK